MVLARLRRVYDAPETALPHFCVPRRPADAPTAGLARPLLSEDVRGSLAGIAEWAGFVARLFPTDPNDLRTHGWLLDIATELEELAHGLRWALEQHEPGGLANDNLGER
jgi:hypothetical protein